MNTNITIPKQEIAPGVFSTGGTATMPTINPISGQPNVIGTEALAQTYPINLTGTIPNQPVDTSLVANATQNAQAFDLQSEYQRQLDLQKQTTPDQTPLNDILASLTNAEQGLTGRGAEQLTAETQAGIPEAQKARATLQGQIKSQLAEYNALKTEFEKMSADIEAGAGRKGLTTGAVMGQQGAVDRAKLARLNSKASEIGLLQAQDEALAGNIEAAQKTVDRAIDLKYQDKEAEYQIKKLQYDRIKDSLTVEEKKRGEAMAAALKKEETALAEKKENEKAIEKMLLDATPNAPASVIANAKAIKDKGGSALEVAQALGKYGGDYLKTELLKQQIETEKAQRSKYYADIAKINAEMPTPATSVEATSKVLDQVKFLKSTLASAKALSGASGRSGARKFVENIAVGSTDYTRLKQYTDTLATNILTLSSDPNIKKFFGPQMTENDVKMMIASGTVLNPENISPEDYLAEAKRLEVLVQKMEDAVISKTPEGQYVNNIVENALVNSSNTQISPSAYINSLK